DIANEICVRQRAGLDHMEPSGKLRGMARQRANEGQSNVGDAGKRLDHPLVKEHLARVVFVLSEVYDQELLDRVGLLCLSQDALPARERNDAQLHTAQNAAVLHQIRDALAAKAQKKQPRTLRFLVLFRRLRNPVEPAWRSQVDERRLRLRL